MTPEQALSILTNLANQTRMLPQEVDIVREAISVLGMLISPGEPKDD